MTSTLVSEAGLRTEYPFVLPRGFVDGDGRLHRSGTMRLATAKDELTAHCDPFVRQHPAYLSVFLLARTVTSLGDVSIVDQALVERLFASDLAFLQDFYRQINAEGHTRAAVECPYCAEPFEVELGGSRLGES